MQEPSGTVTTRILAAVIAVFSAAAYSFVFPYTRRLFYTVDGWRMLGNGVADWTRDALHSPFISAVVILASAAIIYAAVRLIRG